MGHDGDRNSMVSFKSNMTEHVNMRDTYLGDFQHLCGSLQVTSSALQQRKRLVTRRRPVASRIVSRKTMFL